ncbi:MAG: hypothetical protein JXQ29_05445 [Planctomycetes bacterium]|nr:hypothetical protein [Planctomycetota bacterium]
MLVRRTPRGRWTLLSAALALLLLPCATAAAQDAAPAVKPAVSLAESFPPGTMAVFQTKDVSRIRDWFEKSPFASMAKDPEGKPTWDALSGKVKEWNVQLQQDIGVDFLAMASQIGGEVSFGLTGLQLFPVPSPKLLLAIDCGDGAETFHKDVDALLKKLVPEGMFTRSEREVKGVSIATFTPLKKEAQGRRQDPLETLGAIHMAWVGSALVLGNDKSAFDSLVQIQQGDADIASLGQSTHWRDTMERLGGAGDFNLYLNVQVVAELLEAASGMLPQAAGAVVAALRLDQFPALAMSTKLDAAGMTSRSLVRYTGDGKSGLGALLAFRKMDLAIPGWVADDAMEVAIFNYDFSGAFDGVLGLVREAGESTYEELQEGLDGFEQMFGMSLQEDLIGALAGRVIMVSHAAPKAAAAVTEGLDAVLNPFGGQSPLLFGIALRNRKPIEQLFELAESQGAEVSEYMGATILTGPSFSEEGPVLEAAVTEGYFLFGMGPSSIVRPTLQRMGGREAGFGGTEGVRNAVARLPREGAGLFVTNMGKSLANSINVMQLILNLGGADVADLASIPVPSAALFEKYFGYTAGVLTFTAGVGLVLDSYWQFNRP